MVDLIVFARSAYFATAREKRNDTQRDTEPNGLYIAERRRLSLCVDNDMGDGADSMRDDRPTTHNPQRHKLVTNVGDK